MFTRECAVHSRVSTSVERAKDRAQRMSASELLRNLTQHELVRLRNTLRTYSFSIAASSRIDGVGDVGELDRSLLADDRVSFMRFSTSLFVLTPY